MSFWQRLINVPSPDPDIARRHRLLNILLVNLCICCIVVFVLTVLLSASFKESFGFIQWLSLLAMGIFIGIYFLGRYRSGRVASMTLLTMLMILLFLSDGQLELTHGRSTIYFVLPIVMASMLLRPSASFIMAVIVIFVHSLFSISLNVIPNFLTAVIYLSVALVSWLMANSLEQTLNDLRKINRELDQRVADRTHELSEALLREQAETGRNRSILQSITDSVLVFDPQGRLTLTNPPFNQLVGKTLPEMMGQSMLALLGEAISVQQQKMIEALFETPDPTQSVQIDYDRKVLLLNLAPVLLESGQAIGTVAVLRDVTQEVQLSRMKNTFLAMASHELRTPVSVIFGITEILQQKLFGPLNDKQQEVLARLMGNVQKLMVLVKDLLDHTKLEAGMLVVHHTAFSLSELMSTLRESTQGAATTKGLQLVTQIDPDLPDVLVGDLQRLSQILENLVTNAIKFTATGQIQVRLYKFDPTHWAMEVRDTGPGIDPEAGAHIFEPFWQVDSSISREHGGVGLGLAIVQQLVGLMDGEIRMESDLGVGSTFTVVMPLQLAEKEV
jgi:PAS domain S-box-containing protein